MANIINKARIKQRSLVITLLDLKNAFGEVHHNLVTSVLDYHHIPEHIKLIVASLYTNFQTSIITSEFRTPFITVGRGVLQGNCRSPLLFNMCFNTFIQHMKAENLARWAISTTSDCTYCLALETLLHVVAGCQSYIERNTWGHDYVLNFLATNLQTVSGSCLYVDLPGYKIHPSLLVTFIVLICCCQPQVDVYISWN
jgi:hypothetical protein